MRERATEPGQPHDSAPSLTRRAGVGWCVFVGLLLIADTTQVSAQQSVQLNQTTFRVADGWTLELVASEPLTRYPVHADVAPDGRLFIVESSGSNEPVKEQLEKRPHRLVTLRDTDGDGVYDERVVFAEGLMLPQGVLWTPDGVLVATPPEIWCFRDTDGDGISDQRDVWFDGQTLTGCANDVHGPFMGRGGMIHWTKGAFAEQTHPQPTDPQWTTRASHVFRRSLSGQAIEPVMTGGMDNPVEFVQSLCGERFFTCTFVQYPADGRRDALVHAVYGGVYGKDHGVLQGHPRTGALMPVMTHLGPAAPAGLALRQAALSDDDPLGELLVAQFNLQRVSRHQLVEDGASLTTVDSDLLVADRADFHPTDVLEDRDGSLLVIDTGGWYTLCCPTSHINQSQATGAIYRLRRTAPAPNSTQQHQPGSVVSRVEAVWARVAAIGQAAGDDAAAERATTAPLFAALIDHLDDSHPSVRLAAIQGLGIYRHQPATERLIAVLAEGTPREQRYAAEALGRIGDPSAIGPLVAAIARQARQPVGSADAQRVAQHALLYALIELGPASGEALLPHLAGNDREVGATAQRVAALRVLDQLESPELTADAVLAMLAAGSEAERELASEVLGRHPAWDAIVAGRLAELLVQGADQLAASVATGSQTSSWPATVQRLVLRPALAEAVAAILAEGPAVARDQVLQALVTRPPTQLDSRWSAAIAGRLQTADLPTEELTQWCRVLAAVNWRDAVVPAELATAFRELLLRYRDQRETWLVIAAAVPPGVAAWTATVPVADADPASNANYASNANAGAIPFSKLLAVLGPDASPAERQLVLATLNRQPLAVDQPLELAGAVAKVGPMELMGLLTMLRPLHDDQLNRQLLVSLAENPQTAGLPASLLQAHFAEHPAAVQDEAAKLIQQVAGDELDKRRAHMQQLMASLPDGDAGRGMDVFRSTRASCSACHAIGYVGGKVGPDLTGIRRIRTDYDLVEAIVYPSASFVRSYETVQVMTLDGRALSGMIADEDTQSITLTTGIDQRIRVERDDIDSLRPGAVSIMPAGLDQQLTVQELADLLAFLKAQR